MQRNQIGREQEAVRIEMNKASVAQAEIEKQYANMRMEIAHEQQKLQQMMADVAAQSSALNVLMQTERQRVHVEAQTCNQL